jgi:hypothetical protein
MTKPALLLLSLTALLGAHFPRGQKVPLDRLRKNVAAQFSEYRNPAEAHYLLGRLESLAFSEAADSVEVFPGPGHAALPRVAVWSWVQENNQTPSPPRLAPQSKELFFSSIGHYRQAIALDPRNPLFRFSMAWMEQQGQRFVSEIGPPKPPLAPEGETTSWQTLAIRSYREAYRLAPTPTRMGLGPQISVQAGQALIAALTADNNPTAETLQEIQQIQAKLESYKKLPFAITPLIFSTRPNVCLEDLLSDTTVPFDLDGFAEGRRWPWLRPDTALLVWDPGRKGRIDSGRRLFGSVTWWMFWNNGFEPLAALDDNHDGRLTGDELDGIAIWQDRNGNGVSDPGEVIPAAQFGITAIAVRPQVRIDGVLAAPGAVVSRKGSFTLFDWTPRAEPPPFTRSGAPDKLRTPDRR